MNNALLYAIAFSQIQGINNYVRTALIKYFGSAFAIYNERQKGETAFKGIEGDFRPAIMAAWPLKAAAAEIETMTKLGIDTTFMVDAI